MDKMGTERPRLLHGVPHVKRQTGRVCTGTLVYDQRDDEYSCLACGWCVDAREVDEKRLLHWLFGEEVTFGVQEVSKGDQAK